MLFAVLCRLYRQKTVPEVLNASRGRRLKAVLKTSLQQMADGFSQHEPTKATKTSLFFRTVLL